MKKIFSFLLLFIAAIFTTGCLNLNSVENKDNNSNLNEQNEVKNEVVLYQSSNEVVTSTVEEAVSKVYDSVVVINVSSVYSAGSGSGVIIGEDDTKSYIITCHHVIAGATSFEVILSDGTNLVASLVGGDEVTDIAVLSIAKTGLNCASFIEDSHDVRLASTAIAIGNPLGTLGGTVSVGVISSTNRMIQMSDGTMKDLLQTDAAINSGNSGGGLFNVAGELIGIVNAKYSATGVEGLGFAIPANTARSIATGLIEKGYVEGRYDLGVTFADGYLREGGFFGTSKKVVYISEVDKNGSCYGYLAVEDIITNITVSYKDNEKDNSILSSITESQDVINFFNSLELEIGDSITFTVRRDDYNANPIQVTVEIKQYIYN